MDIRETEITTRAAERQLLMIEAEQRKNRGMQIMDVNFLLHRLETKFVRGTV